MDSIYDIDASGTDDSASAFYAQDLLPPKDFSEADLIAHLQTHDWDLYSKYILQDCLQNLDLGSDGILSKAHGERHHQGDANHEESDIYHVGIDGCPLRLHRGDSEDGPVATWEALKSTNSDDSRKQAVGRIVTMREPTPIIFAALHLTMNEYFDMDSIYRLLIHDYHPSSALTKGFLNRDHRRQRSIVFVFKYHTIVGEGHAPLRWQAIDIDLESADNHSSLTTCSCIVALSLAGRPPIQFDDAISEMVRW